MGNVRAVISGIKVNAWADVLEYADYYALGSVARSGGTMQYRYGYQGQYAGKDAKGVAKIAIKFFKAKRIVNIVVDSIVVWASASEAYRNSTRLGHSLSKHANRPGGSAIWGKLKGHISTWHDQASKHYNDIMSAPGEFRRVPNKEGIIFLEKWLPDGRGLRLNRDQTFKGFID